MHLILFKSLISALAVAPAVYAGEDKHSALRSNRQSKDDDSAPLSLDVVIRNVAKHLWSGSRPRTFYIKGSYPAAVWAYEHSDLNLPYNDIDVTVDAPTQTDECQNGYNKKSQFGPTGVVDNYFVEGLIPGSDTSVQVVSLCDIDNPEYLITKYSDINSVSIGFIVTPDEHGEAVLHKWAISAKFKEFLQTKILEEVKENVVRSSTPEKSIIRLLHKGQQMNMEYNLPEDMEETFHGNLILPYYKSELDRLEAKHKDVIYSRFSLIPVYKGKMFMYVRKGYKPPAPPSYIDGINFINRSGNNNSGHSRNHSGNNNSGHNHNHSGQPSINQMNFNNRSGNNNSGHSRNRSGNNNSGHGRNHSGQPSNNRSGNNNSDHSNTDSSSTCTQNCYCYTENCVLPKCEQNCYIYGNGNTNMPGCLYNCYCYGTGRCDKGSCKEWCYPASFEAGIIAKA